MKSPIIIEGHPADWEAHGRAADRVQNPGGGVNWGAAMLADPGVMSCPACGEHMWCEGLRVRCPYCAHEFDTRLKRTAKSRANSVPGTTDPADAADGDES